MAKLVMRNNAELTMSRCFIPNGVYTLKKWDCEASYAPLHRDVLVMVIASNDQQLSSCNLTA